MCIRDRAWSGIPTVLHNVVSLGRVMEKGDRTSMYNESVKTQPFPPVALKVYQVLPVGVAIGVALFGLFNVTEGDHCIPPGALSIWVMITLSMAHTS